MLALACLITACSGHPAGHVEDSQRSLMLGALPDDALERGVYIFEGDLEEDLSPGSLVAPIIGTLIQQADLVVETGAPPVTLLSGLGQDVELPPQMTRVGDVAILGSEEDVVAVQDGLKDGSELTEPLALLAGSSAPVGWAGPLPGCAPGTAVDPSEGTVVVALSEDSFELTVTGPSAEELEPHVEIRIQEEAPPSSPGKPWRSILADVQVSREGDLLVIEATPTDLPGGLLRLLLDTRELDFLRPTDCD